MEDFRQNLKTVMAPYKVGAMPKYLKTNGEIKKLENDWGDNEVKASALRDMIKKETGGKVEVTDSINDENSLLGILRSYMRMKNYGNGNLVPDNVTVFDKDPNTIVNSGVVGEYLNLGGSKENRDPISVRNTSIGDKMYKKSAIDTASNRWSPTMGDSVDDTITHELAHGAQFAYDDLAQRYYDEKYKEAKSLEGKYTTDAILKNSLPKIKYAIPKLFDAVFGTHIVPTEEEWHNMTDKNASRFWADNFEEMGLDNYYYENGKLRRYSAQKEMLDKASDKVAAVRGGKFEEGDGSQSLFEKAAKNTGFNSVDEANASISEYATTNWTEAFAEAYSDVLLNGDDAKPYSKELVRLYSEAADKWKKYLGKDSSAEADMLKQLMDVSPLKDTLSIKKKGAK